MEQKILQALLQSRKNYIDLQKFKIWISLSDQGQVLYSFISSFYEADPDAEQVDPDILKEQIKRKFPKQADIYSIIIDKLYAKVRNLSVPNLIKEIITVKKEALGRELSSKLLQPGASNAQGLMEEYLQVETATTELFEDSDILINLPVVELAEELSSSHKIRLWPQHLQDSTGGALRGHNILIFGRPEIGKSLIAINLVGGLLYDGYKVLFIENEDPSKVTLSRIISRITGKDIFYILEHPKEVQELLDKSNYKNLIIKSLSPGTFMEINSLIERISPDVVVINQVHNIHVGKAETVIQRERVAKLSRNTAKKYDILMINVCQAGESAENKLVLDMGDIDFSNTGMPAQYDLIVGIGCNQDMEQRGRRVISLCKNKLSGQHDYFSVLVDTKLSKAVSI